MGITWEHCIRCEVKFPTPSLTKEKVCLYCEPPQGAEK